MRANLHPSLQLPSKQRWFHLLAMTCDSRIPKIHVADKSCTTSGYELNKHSNDHGNTVRTHFQFGKYKLNCPAKIPVAMTDAMKTVVIPYKISQIRSKSRRFYKAKNEITVCANLSIQYTPQRLLSTMPSHLRSRCRIICTGWFASSEKIHWMAMQHWENQGRPTIQQIPAAKPF